MVFGGLFVVRACGGRRVIRPVLLLASAFSCVALRSPRAGVGGGFHGGWTLFSHGVAALARPSAVAVGVGAGVNPLRALPCGVRGGSGAAPPFPPLCLFSAPPGLAAPGLAFWCCRHLCPRSWWVRLQGDPGPWSRVLCFPYACPFVPVVGLALSGMLLLGGSRCLAACPPRGSVWPESLFFFLLGFFLRCPPAEHVPHCLPA